MRVPVHAHHDIQTDETSFEYQDIPDNLMIGAFQNLYQRHLRLQKGGKALKPVKVTDVGKAG